MTPSLSTPLTVQQVGERTLLLVWQGDPAPRSARVCVRIGEAAAAAPFAQIKLPLDGRRHRNILALGIDPRVAAPSIEISHRDGAPIARFDGEAGAWRHAIEFDAHVLAAGLPVRERARLTRFLVEVCGSLFRLEHDPVFAAALRTLLSETVSGFGKMVTRCRLTPDLLFCETLVPESLGERTSAVVVGGDGISRVAAEPGCLPIARPKPGHTALGLVLPHAVVARGATVLVFGAGGLVRRVLPTVPSNLPGVHEWLANAGDGRPDHRRFLLDRLSDGKLAGAAEAALSRELQVLTPGATGRFQSLDAAAALVIAGESGVLVIGRLDDPWQLAADMEVERRGIARAVPASGMVRFDPRTPLGTAGTGFAAFVPETGSSARVPVRLSLRLHSDARIAFGDGPTLSAPEQAQQAILATVPDDRTDDALLACIAPVMRDLSRERRAFASVREVLDIGRRIAQPKTSVLVPFCDDAELLRCRMGVLAADPSLTGAEFLYLVERAGEATAARRILVDLHAAYGVASRLVVFAQEPPFACMIEIAAGLASGSFVALLGRTVVPETQGWLPALVGHLEAHPRCGIVGAQILNPDQSLLSAGCEIATGEAASGGWALRPLLRGFPRDCTPAAAPGRVAALPGECLALGRALARDLPARAGDVLHPDSVIAGMCLAASARGLEVWRLPEPAVVSYRGRTGSGTEAPTRLSSELDRRELERLWRRATGEASVQHEPRTEGVPGLVAATPAAGRRKAA